MKFSILIFAFFILITGCGAIACNKEDNSIKTESNIMDNNNGSMTGSTIRIKVGSKTFAATILDNNSAKAFKELLPLTIIMTELNGNEKYYDLSKSLPTNSSSPGNIKNGDLMLYGSRTLVLFYKGFSTSYSYTRLGTVNDASGLAAALGSANVTVTFELE
ncbi:cyclophilin-like fold protein [Niabella sp. CJ426]|uniref:cyclophilin-like fold protein n=1 Tax=Niabella sp. CJ426 TaxID=3393740 RepID=UPI003CFE63DC